MAGGEKRRRQVLCIGTADTKLEELLFLARSLRSFLPSSTQLEVTIVDVSAGENAIESAEEFSLATRKEVLSSIPAEDPLHSSPQLPSERGESVKFLSGALTFFLKKSHAAGTLAGAIGIGGSGGTSLISPALRCLPLGVPKILVSTVASGQTGCYIGTSDLILIPSVVDICGINRISSIVLSNAAAAMAGMVTNRFEEDDGRSVATVGITMFGVTTPCVKAVSEMLKDEGFETLIFHATGAGGRAMEDLVRTGAIQGVLDLTTTEVADFVVGGVMACDESRFDAMIEKGIPLLISAGALDMVNFGPRDTIPAEFSDRKIHIHNEQVSLMRTTAEENRKFAEFIARKINQLETSVRICLPTKGLSALDSPGQPFHDPEARDSLIHTLEELIQQKQSRQVKKYPFHINDAEFARAVVESFLEIAGRPRAEASVRSIIPKRVDNFPNAKRGTLEVRARVLGRLREQIERGKAIIGAGAGTGISAKMEEEGGADMVVIYNSGRFRMAGRGSLAGLLPFADANAVVLDMANEVLPVIKSIPVLAGVCATDPFRRIDHFLRQLEDLGFSGVQNFPTVGLFDGNFRQNLEETGMGYSLEVEMIRKAHEMGLLTTPYAFNEEECIAMVNAGADVIVAHMGLTSSGTIGAKTVISLEDSVRRVQAIADVAVKVNPEIIILCHGGPISGVKEAEFVLKNTRGVHGFYGASSMERLPVEEAITSTMRRYKSISIH